MKTTFTPGYSWNFLPQVFLIAALANEFLGAEKTAMRTRMWSESEHGLGCGSVKAVFSSGLTKIETFLKLQVSTKMKEGFI